MAEPLDKGSSLRVVHVVLSLDVGGLERIVLDLVAQGRELGQSVSVVCLERRGALAEGAEAAGARVYCAGKGPGVKPTLVGKVQAMLGEIKADVVHTHQIGALFYAGAAARGAGVPLVVHTEHGKNYEQRLRTRIVGRLAARHARRFFCVSRDIADEVVARGVAPAHKVRVLRNGIDVERFGRAVDTQAVRASLAIPPGVWVVGSIGRLAEIKRYELLVAALAELAGEETHLVIVGDGPLRESLRAQAAALGIAGRVHLAGYQAEPEKFLRAMDVFALTSRSEGMPLAVLEAWAAGVPVVAARVGGLAEIIDADRTGLLVQPGDARALAGAIGRVLGDAALAGRMRQAALHEVRSKYTLGHMARQYEDEYRQLLRGQEVLA